MMGAMSVSTGVSAAPAWPPLYPLAGPASPGRRLAVFPLVRIGLAVAVFVVLELPFQVLHLGWGTFVGAAFVNAGAALVALTVVTRWVDRRPLAAAGFGRCRIGREAGYGAVTGLGMFAAVIAILAASGGYHVTAVHPSRLGVAAGMVVVFVLAATFEEIIFRALLFRLLEEWLGTWLALLVPAALFALSHAVDNKGATVISTVATFVAGLWTAVAYALTRQLWFPIAAHAAWNLAESLCGTTVSGDKLPRLIVDATLTGPSWWTGGAYGPEAGLPVLVVITVATGVLLYLSTRADRVIAPSWRRA